jgi:hypothetical protein
MTSACLLIPFPLSRRVGKVRRVAEVYERKDDKGRDTYWRTETNRLQDQLIELGFSSAEIRTQMLGFKDAVQCEIHRRYCEGRGGTTSDDPRGAA